MRTPRVQRERLAAAPDENDVALADGRALYLSFFQRGRLCDLHPFFLGLVLGAARGGDGEVFVVLESGVPVRAVAEGFIF